MDYSGRAAESLVPVERGARKRDGMYVGHWVRPRRRPSSATALEPGPETEAAPNVARPVDLGQPLGEAVLGRLAPEFGESLVGQLSYVVAVCIHGDHLRRSSPSSWPL